MAQCRLVLFERVGCLDDRADGASLDEGGELAVHALEALARSPSTNTRSAPSCRTSLAASSLRTTASVLIPARRARAIK